jgi:hypothetical protein
MSHPRRTSRGKLRAVCASDVVPLDHAIWRFGSGRPFQDLDDSYAGTGTGTGQNQFERFQSCRTQGRELN